MHVKKVLDVLKKEKLYVKLSKCEFGKTSLVYLGHIVGHGQLQAPTKMKKSRHYIWMGFLQQFHLVIK
jgi:hypothetical protein